MKKNRTARMKRAIPVLSAVRFVEPMAAALVDALPTGNDWLYEAKFDGYRALTLKDGASVKILSRKGNDLTANYPAIRQAVAALKAKSAVVDGEIVAFDETGRPSFQQLHHRSANPAAIRYFAFDLLHLNGKDLQAEPLEARRAALERVLSGSDVVFSAELPGTAERCHSSCFGCRARRCRCETAKLAI